MADYIGHQIGNYRLTKEIARGSFGSVYLAQHTVLTERKVAVKLLHAHLNSQQEREQFLQEARYLEQLSHPHILNLIDVGIHDGLPYLIMTYAANGSLRDKLRSYSSTIIPETQALVILSQVGQGLYYAHQKNIIHRDLKPENILFDAQGHALLADFGIATMLTNISMKQVTVISGTPSYMAPEQFRGNVSKESDQYALGCIAYELFTGRLPFSAPDFVSMGYKHTTERPIPPRHFNPYLSSSIEQAILKVLSKQRNERFLDVNAFTSVLFSPPQTQIQITLPRQEFIQTAYSPISQIAPPPPANVARTRQFEYLPSQQGVSLQVASHTSRNSSKKPKRFLLKPFSPTRSPAPKWQRLLSWGFAALEIILLIRFLFRILGADQDSGFITFLYSLTHIFLSPFFGAINDQSLGTRSVLEVTTLFVIVFYYVLYRIILYVSDLLALPPKLGKK